MKAKLVSIGNSKGIRIPTAILKQCNIENEVDLEQKERVNPSLFKIVPLGFQSLSENLLKYQICFNPFNKKQKLRLGRM